MCLILFSWRQRADIPLLLAANRDEFHARPSRAAGFWPEHPEVLAGRDLQAGGTWLGLTRGGRFAAITNFRDPSRTRPAPRTRGELTLNFLLSGQSAAAYISDIRRHEADYAGFNLLLGDGQALWYYSNTGGGAQQLAPGTYGLSNALLDTPWPKVELGRAAFAPVPSTSPSHEQLAAALADRSIASEAGLALQGLEGEMERGLSAQFIVDPVYGTRATTTLWLGADGDCNFREIRYDNRGEESGRTEETFRST
ncbi:NRDE family protein [Haliea sp. E17]|uniref:NRDE family protein n=1 Tax=Haliea sp. E17 TaxID=3401576 RepID=UPI003AAADE91